MTSDSLNQLTFANTGVPGFGFFSAADLSSHINLPRLDEAGQLTGGSLSGRGSGAYTAGNITIGSSTITSNLVIQSTGTVVIAGDITYGGGPYSSVSALPQLVIRARNIIITDAVSQVNAWLVADGYVSTCGAVPDGKAWLQGITSKTCDKQLRINGPVMAQSLYLRRTYGSQHASPAKNDNNHHLGTPAEIINIRPDTYLWGHARSGGRGSIKTTILRELPPRY